DGQEVVRHKDAPKLPRRAREGLDGAKDLPDPASDQGRPVGNSDRVRYATVFAFPSVKEAHAEWEAVQKTLEPLAKPARPWSGREAHVRAGGHRTRVHLWGRCRCDIRAQPGLSPADPCETGSLERRGRGPGAPVASGPISRSLAAGRVVLLGAVGQRRAPNSRR